MFFFSFLFEELEGEQRKQRGKSGLVQGAWLAWVLRIEIGKEFLCMCQFYGWELIFFFRSSFIALPLDAI
jgi:hypothetical protein